PSRPPTAGLQRDLGTSGALRPSRPPTAGLQRDLGTSGALRPSRPLTAGALRPRGLLNAGPRRPIPCLALAEHADPIPPWVRQDIPFDAPSARAHQCGAERQERMRIAEHIEVHAVLDRLMLGHGDDPDQRATATRIDNWHRPGSGAAFTPVHVVFS